MGRTDPLLACPRRGARRGHEEVIGPHPVAICLEERGKTLLRRHRPVNRPLTCRFTAFSQVSAVARTGESIVIFRHGGASDRKGRGSTWQ